MIHLLYIITLYIGLCMGSIFLSGIIKIVFYGDHLDSHADNIVNWVIHKIGGFRYNIMKFIIGAILFLMMPIILCILILDLPIDFMIWLTKKSY